MRTMQKKVTDLDGTRYKDHYVYNFREIENLDKFDVYDTDVTVELDPCPFCGTLGMLNQDPMGWCGWCAVCGCRGSHHHSWITAAKMWNARGFDSYVEASGRDQLEEELRSSGFDMKRIVER